MEPAPVRSHACLSNQQKSGSDTTGSGNTASGAYIYSLAALCRGLKGRIPSTLHFSVIKSVSRKSRKCVYREI